MMIEVIQEDIDFGRQCEIGNCPLALALNRATGHAWGVGGCTCWRLKGPSAVSIMLPDAAQQFVYAFDHGRAVTPISFEIEL
jgi:hypothetical protein